MTRRDFLLLLALTFAALFIHGYHPGVEDSEIYRTAIEKAVHPDLFPLHAEFFESHAHSSLYAKLIATSAQVTGLPLEWIFFLWHILSIFLLLCASWQLTGRFFADDRARWAGVTLLAVLLTLTLGGTALYIMDEYLNPRNLSAFATVFAIVRVLDRKYLQAGAFLAVNAAIHPFMAGFAVVYCVVLAGMQTDWRRVPASLVFSPITFFYRPPSYAYDQVIARHPFHYVQRWTWYEVLGAVAPLFLLWWYGAIAKRREQTAVNASESLRMRNLHTVCRALVYCGIASIALALLLDLPRQFETLARLQPMRMLFITYILFILISSGLLAETILKYRAWRWMLFFLPISAAMCYSQVVLFPRSAHIEWPGAHPRNQWVEAFEWVRTNTPHQAMFALDPEYMHLRGEDENGFRAIAERSRMADAVKDRGGVTMFPELAAEWLRETLALKDWDSFRLSDLSELKQRYGVDWVVLQQPGMEGLSCPYQNEIVLVCRVP